MSLNGEHRRSYMLNRNKLWEMDDMVIPIKSPGCGLGGKCSDSSPKPKRWSQGRVTKRCEEAKAKEITNMAEMLVELV